MCSRFSYPDFLRNMSTLVCECKLKCRSCFPRAIQAANFYLEQRDLFRCLARGMPQAESLKIPRMKRFERLSSQDAPFLETFNFGLSSASACASSLCSAVCRRSMPPFGRVATPQTMAGPAIAGAQLRLESIGVWDLWRHVRHLRFKRGSAAGSEGSEGED